MDRAGDFGPSRRVKLPETDAMEHARRLVAEIDEALAQTPALTGQQLDDVRRLRREVEAHCRSRDVERARHCRELALKLIRSGAPVPE